jgi:hypothetical protein
VCCGMKILGSDMEFGMLTSLFDRFTQNIDWLNIPFLLYTVALYTIKYIPLLKEYIALLVLFLGSGFVIGACIIGYLDYKFMFKSERAFQYHGYFLENFDEINKLLQSKKAARLAARVRQ